MVIKIIMIMIIEYNGYKDYNDKDYNDKEYNDYNDKDYKYRL